MLQTLLADRLKVSLHREKRELPFLALTVAKNGPKLGPAKEVTRRGPVEVVVVDHAEKVPVEN